jgi:hypothetical protein
MQPRRQAIPVLLLVRTAFQLLWQQRDDALRLGLIPALLQFAGTLFGRDAIITVLMQMQGGMAQPQPLPSGLVFTLLASSLIVFAALALLLVNWLRFLLLGPMGAVGIGLSLRAAHFRFLVASFAFGFVLMLGVMVLCLPLLLVGVQPLVANLIAFLAALLLAVRFLPFLVGQAIEQPMSPVQSWSVTRGNALTLAIGVLMVMAMFLVGGILVENVLGAIGFSRVAPHGTLFVATVINIAMWTCIVSLLATAYRHLVGVRV